MKPITEWSEADLQALIDNNVQESLTLDYKASDALAKSDGKKSEVSKDVSAFANSAGGLIIYGIEEAGRPPQPVRIDQGSDPAQISREFLEQVINSNIQPRIRGVRIQPILLASGRMAYVVEVPASSDAPHQAADRRYYRRFEFQSVPMYDYEIRDLLGRQTNPKLELEWRIIDSVRPAASKRLDYEVQVAFMVHNLSPAPALYGALQIEVDEALEPTQPHPNFTAWNTSITGFRGERHSSLQFERLLAVPSDPPIYRERPLSAGASILHFELGKIYWVTETLSCPGFSSTRTGTVAVHPDGRVQFEWIDA